MYIIPPLVLHELASHQITTSTILYYLFSVSHAILSFAACNLIDYIAFLSSIYLFCKPQHGHLDLMKEHRIWNYRNN